MKRQRNEKTCLSVYKILRKIDCSTDKNTISETLAVTADNAVS